MDKLGQIEPNNASVDEINENISPEEKKSQEPSKEIQDMMNGN